MSVGGLYKYNLKEYDYWSVKDNGEYFYSMCSKECNNWWGTEFTESDVKVCTKIGPNVLADWGNE